MKGKKAFTLVEILMVVFIISLISSILLANYNSQNEESKVAATKANLEVLRLAMQMYRSNEGQWPTTDLASLHDGSSPSGHVYIAAIPKEAISDDATVSVIPFYDGGWYLDTSVNWDYQIHPDLGGADIHGTPYSQY